MKQIQDPNADTISVDIILAHSPGYTPPDNPLYTDLPILQNFQSYPETKFHFQLPPSTRLSELKPLIVTQYGLPLELQHSFSPNPHSFIKCDDIPDNKTIVEAIKMSRGTIYIMTTACRIRQIHDVIWWIAKEREQLEWGLKYLQGRLARASEGWDREKQQKLLEEYQEAKDLCLEKLQKMRSDLEKYTGKGDGQAAFDMSEDDIAAWFETYINSHEETHRRIVEGLYKAVKTSQKNEKLLDDITAAEREEAISSLKYLYDEKLLQELNLDNSGASSVTSALRKLLAKDEDKEIYISKTVQQNRDYKKHNTFGRVAQKTPVNALGFEVPSKDVQPKRKDNIRPYDRLVFHHPSFKNAQETSGRPMRDEHGARVIDGFAITSGQLLWGQLHTVIDGTQSKTFDRNADIPPPRGYGGTIIQHRLSYRAAARIGQWKIRRAFGGIYGCTMQPASAEPSKHFGWIMYHEVVQNPTELLLRCRRIGVEDGRSLGNKHIDKDILHVSRYDWGMHYNPDTNISKALQKDAGMKVGNRKGLGNEGALEGLKAQTEYSQGFMMVLDAEKYSASFLRAVLRDCPMDTKKATLTEIVFSERKPEEEESHNFGAFLAMSKGAWEYAWLIFSGEKHEKYKEEDELIAIVFDDAEYHLVSDRYAVET